MVKRVPHEGSGTGLGGGMRTIEHLSTATRTTASRQGSKSLRHTSLVRMAPSRDECCALIPLQRGYVECTFWVAPYLAEHLIAPAAPWWPLAGPPVRRLCRACPGGRRTALRLRIVHWVHEIWSKECPRGVIDRTWRWDEST